MQVKFNLWLYALNTFVNLHHLLRISSWREALSNQKQLKRHGNPLFDEDLNVDQASIIFESKPDLFQPSFRPSASGRPSSSTTSSPSSKGQASSI